MSDRLRNDDGCFVCGRMNSCGLKLSPRASEGASSIDWTPGREHQGWDGIVHGGLVSTLLDEAMAYAAMSLGSFCATREITVRFRRPVRPEVPLRASARVVEERGRLIRLEADVIQEGEERATATGTFVALPGGEGV